MKYPKGSMYHYGGLLVDVWVPKGYSILWLGLDPVGMYNEA